jgi:energy-coupling factor transporter ATP-binding protein EcfA2
MALTVYVHQDPYILMGSVFQNLSFFLPGLRGTELRERVSDSLETLGLGGYEKKRAATLSGGEKKRLALARALAARKEVLLLDEPTANVDAASTGMLVERLQLLKEKGITLVVATHDEDFSRRIADRYYHFSDGFPEERR